MLIKQAPEAGGCARGIGKTGETGDTGSKEETTGLNGLTGPTVLRHDLTEIKPKMGQIIILDPVLELLADLKIRKSLGNFHTFLKLVIVFRDNGLVFMNVTGYFDSTSDGGKCNWLQKISPPWSCSPTQDRILLDLLKFFASRYFKAV